MRILILGSGAREHAIAWKLKQEIGEDNIYIAPGNAGTQMCGKNIDVNISDFESLKKVCLENNVDTVLPGSEEAIANGVRDYFEGSEDSKHIYVFSPDKHAGKLESSKAFAKEFMQKLSIPTAAYKSFTVDELEEGYTFLEKLNPPYVLKADGLAAGKGVLIIDNLDEAKKSLKDMLANEKFGSASSRVVIEEFLDGIEFSVFALTDGEHYVMFPEAKDYKRIGEGDKGLNTGGMGAVSPVPFYTADLHEKTMNQIVIPTINGLKSQNLEFRGFVFFGLILVENNPMVIEYNVRLGDPETEVIIPRLNESLSQMILDSKNGELVSRDANKKTEHATTVFAVSGGYPEQYDKGKIINIASDCETLFHAGTKRDDDGLYTNGGRVVAATCYGNSMDDALKS
ncbi:MAG: phosphoribosylamine--glycine ligase, partial [Bacteroidia bacterium]|nr:phosphoribosylamine--glycine ligase [Bacteroidia bacterium]